MAAPGDVIGDGSSPCAGDCDDADTGSAQGALEDCDGSDNNCDGGVDEGCGDDDSAGDEDSGGDDDSDDDDANSAEPPAATPLRPGPGCRLDHGGGLNQRLWVTVLLLPALLRRRRRGSVQRQVAFVAWLSVLLTVFPAAADAQAPKSPTAEDLSREAHDLAQLW